VRQVDCQDRRSQPGWAHLRRFFPALEPVRGYRWHDCGASAARAPDRMGRGNGVPPRSHVVRPYSDHDDAPPFVVRARRASYRDLRGLALGGCVLKEAVADGRNQLSRRKDGRRHQRGPEDGSTADWGGTFASRPTRTPDLSALVSVRLNSCECRQTRRVPHRRRNRRAA
jgi:hypothetical protein